MISNNNQKIKECDAKKNLLNQISYNSVKYIFKYNIKIIRVCCLLTMLQLEN